MATSTIKKINAFNTASANDYGKDCDNFPSFTIIWANEATGVTNIPASGAYYVITLDAGISGYKMQIAISYQGGELYTRGYVSSSWTAWHQY